jgi:membrane protein
VRSLVEGVTARLPRPLRAGWRLASRTVAGSVRDRVPGLAAEVAFFALLSLPALLLMLLGSLGYIAEALGPQGRAELDRLVFEVPRTFLTQGTYDSYADIARNVVREGRADVVSFGALLSLWTGSRVVARSLQTVAIAYDLEDSRPVWYRRLLALGLTLGGLLVGVAILPALVLGPQIVGLLAQPSVEQAAARLVDVFFWPGMSLLVLLVLISFYHAGTPWKTPWRRDVPGAVLAVVLWMLAAVALRIYVTFSLDSEGVYGQLAAPLAVVLWLYVTAFAVLLGAELNAEIEKLWPHRDVPWRLIRRSRPGVNGRRTP